MLFCTNCRVKLHNYKKRGWGLKRHTCRQCYCFNCKFTYHSKEDRHLCYMCFINSAKCQQKTLHQFTFYDFKSMLLCNSTQRPNQVVAKSICEHCSVHESTCSTCSHQCMLCDKWNGDGTHFDHPPCTDCGQREVVFRGEKTRMILQLVVLTPTQGSHSHSTQCTCLCHIFLVQLSSLAMHHTQHHLQRFQDNVL